MEKIGLPQLKDFRIGIAGAGGLGSNAAIALIRTGIKHIVIADSDRVEASNLNRQYFFADQIGMPKVEAFKANALRINRDAVIETHFTKVVPENIVELFSRCHLLIEAFDKADEKIMLIETFIRYFPEKPIIIGSGIGGWGKSNDICAEQIGNIIICGDSQSEVSDKCPPLAPRVGIVAHMQANEAIRILMERSMECK